MFINNYIENDDFEDYRYDNLLVDEDNLLLISILNQKYSMNYKEAINTIYFNN